MSYIVATETIVLYRPLDLSIIGEVYAGQKYNEVEGVEVFIGSLEDFLNQNPEYKNDELC